MSFKKIKFVLIFLLLYQTPLQSKSITSNNFDSNNLSKYFSGIVAFENKDNSTALDFFNSSKILTTNHDPYLKKYMYSLVLENKISQAINLIKKNKGESNTNFFEGYILLVIDSLKKNDLKRAKAYLNEIDSLGQQDRLNSAILESFEQYLYVFKEKKNYTK